MIEKIIAEQLDIDIDAVTDDKNLMEDLGADSLDTVQIVMELEEAFDVEITDEDAETLVTIGAIKKYIEENT
tara:strand:- start:821 stop:1036 length:216 start_codon:yes stop_codon:yes gene_type:complete